MWAGAVLMLLSVPARILELVHPGFGLLVLPVVIGYTACALVAYWKVMTGTASFMRGAGDEAVAGDVLSARNIYMILYFCLLVVGLCAGVLAVFAFKVKSAVEIWWVGLLCLPLHWLFGWLFVLRPLGQARDALRHGPGAAPATA